MITFTSNNDEDEDENIILKDYLTATVYHESYDAYNDKYIDKKF